jgi:hypothetical protein
MKTVTTQEALNLLEEIGHQATVTVIVKDEHGDDKKGYVLNEAMVYDPFTNKQRGMSDNKDNAERAMKQLQKTGNKFSVYSAYFSWATGEYEIED